MLKGILECHYGDYSKCEDFFSKALKLSRNDTICHNYILAMEWLGKYRNAVRLASESLNDVFELTSLINILELGKETFKIDLIQECLNRINSLSLDFDEVAIDSFFSTISKFKNTPHYNDGDENGYSELIMDFYEKYPKLIIEGVRYTYDKNDEVLHILFLIKDLYKDEGNTFFESQEYLIDNVFLRDLNQRIIVSHISGVRGVVEHAC
jgi:tetratricopeptide (TPR) repeat protein